tara:strand:+ start:44 stop:544 length:501 start_codon:yes stop_codon:yes gene_type:complete
MLAGDGFFGQRNTTSVPSAQDFLKDFRGGFENIFSSGPSKYLPFPFNLQYGITEGMFAGLGNKEKKDPKTDNKKGTYGGLTFDDIEKLQKAGFDQQNELFKKGMIVDAGRSIGKGLTAGPQAYVEKVLPQMFAGNAAILSAGASGNRSLAMTYGQPIQSLRRSFFV